ncbi:hypothetical protein OsJ_28844 [Oryza sativa Japonica Group]|uniref:Uncharacterized protein n=1 Tax=Oryza sativa subsp. japonica TaxID=39947 RepID=B9G2U9_ORYSJ|nr:hypothetical protein OsJ_28844 [Oryza sativa Japonica Group]
MASTRLGDTDPAPLPRPPVASSSANPPPPARSDGSLLHRTTNRWIRRPLPPTAGVVHRLLHPLAPPPFPTLVG